MFHQKFFSVEDFIRTSYEKRGLSTALFHFVLQEQDHQILDECIRILLRSGRWDTTITNKLSGYPIPAQYPYQDDMFAMAMGINRGYIPSSRDYPLCLHLQHGNPLILDIFYHLRRRTDLATAEDYDAMMAQSPIRQLQCKLLTTMNQHHYTRSQIDLHLYAEFMCQLLSDEKEDFHHWYKIDTQNEAILKRFTDLYPQFHELQLNKLSRFRIISAIWSLPHPRLFALISANRADSIINRTQLLILLEKRHLPYAFSLIQTIDQHLDRARGYMLRGNNDDNEDGDDEDDGGDDGGGVGDDGAGGDKTTLNLNALHIQVQTSATSGGAMGKNTKGVMSLYERYKKDIYLPELDPTLGVTGLIPDKYLDSFDAGCYTNLLNGGQMKFTSFQAEIDYLEQFVAKYRLLILLIWKVYAWIDFPSSLQVIILVLIQFSPKTLEFLPWIPNVEGKIDLFITFDKTYVDQMSIVKASSLIGPTAAPTGQSDQPNSESNTTTTTTTTQPPLAQFTSNYDPALVKPFERDLVQILDDNRRYLMSVINPEIYGRDLVVVAPEFAPSLSTDSHLSSLQLFHSKATRSPTQQDQLSQSQSQFPQQSTPQLQQRTVSLHVDPADNNTIPAPVLGTSLSDHAGTSSPKDTKVGDVSAVIDGIEVNTAQSAPLGASTMSYDLCDDSQDKSERHSPKLIPGEPNQNAEKVGEDGEDKTATTTPPLEDQLSPLITSTRLPSLDGSSNELTPESTPIQHDSMSLSSESEQSSITSGMFSMDGALGINNNLRSCLPLDQKNRRQKRSVQFQTVIYSTNDSRPMVRDGKVLGHDDDIRKHEDYIAQFDHKLKGTMLKSALVFATISNLTTVIDYVIDTTGRALNDIMTFEASPKQAQMQGHREEKQGGHDNLIAAACHVPHCSPSTIQYLFRRRSKLCTNNKTGRENNAFLVLYQTDRHWLYERSKYAKLLVLWLQVKQNERVYKPHLDFHEFINSTINQLYNSTLSYWFFTFIIEHLLSPAERAQTQQNAIRVCDILACLYNPSHSTNFSATSLIPNTARFLGPPGTQQQGLSRQHCAYPSNLTIADLDLALPPIRHYTSYHDVKDVPYTSDMTATMTSTTNPTTATNSTPTQYSTIICPKSETNLDPTTSLKDAYHQYECAQRQVYLHYFVHSKTIALFLPPNPQYLVTEEFPAEIFTPDQTRVLTAEDPDLEEEDAEDDSNDNKDQGSASTTTTTATTTNNNNKKSTNNKKTSNPDKTDTPTSPKPPQSGNKKTHPKTHALNVKLYLETSNGLTQSAQKSFSMLKLIDPLAKCNLDRLQSLTGIGSPSPPPPPPMAAQSPAQTPTSPGVSPTPPLPSFLTQSGPNQYLAPPRGQQRDHLQQLMYPFIEFRDLNALRYLFDLGISTKSMWQRLISLQHIFFDIRDIVEYIPRDLYTNRKRYNIDGLNPTSLITENPWLTLGSEIYSTIIAKKADPIINPDRPWEITFDYSKTSEETTRDAATTTTTATTNDDDDEDDVDYSNLPPLEDIETLVAQGINPEDLFGAVNRANSSPGSEPPAPVVFESVNQNPFLTKEFLTTKHRSPMLQMLQLFLLYDNSLFEYSIPQGPRNLATTACLSFNWPIAQALYLTNTDTMVPHNDISKYQHTQYCYPQPALPPPQPTTTTTTTTKTDIHQVPVSQGYNPKFALINLNDGHPIEKDDDDDNQPQTQFRQYHYDAAISSSYKHDLLRIIGGTPQLSSQLMPKPADGTEPPTGNERGEINLDEAKRNLPPRTFNKLTDPLLSSLRASTITPTFTPQFHVDYLHVLLMFLLPQRNINPITNYFSMQLFELIFSHVLRDYSIFDTAQREELLIYLRRSLVVHSFLPQNEKGLYEGPVKGVVKLVMEHSKDVMMKQVRFKEETYINSIKTLYKYNVLMTTTKPKQSEYLFLFTQTHLLHPALVLDMFWSFVRCGGEYSRPFPVLKYSLVEFLQWTYAQSETKPKHIENNINTDTTTQPDGDQEGDLDKFSQIVQHFDKSFHLNPEVHLAAAAAAQADDDESSSDE